MTDPQDFQWPLPTTLTDVEVKAVYAGAVAGAAAFRVTIVDEATNYAACLAQACADWVLDELDRRGVPRETFPDIEPEDFNDA